MPPATPAAADPLVDGVGIHRGRLPRHVAIIMDGNGRWAQERGLPRIRGHYAGVKSVREITETAASLGLEQLTLYAFSAENWRRSEAEVSYLMRLLKVFMIRERATLRRNNVRLEVIGEIEGLPAAARREIEVSRGGSASATGLTLCLALNYGGRLEIARAARRIAEEAAAGRLDPASVNEACVAARLYTAGMPDPDLLIRTAGEMRISNFLLWQVSYTELYVTDVLWPDFRKDHLFQALRAYARRVRKFGGLPGFSPRGAEKRG